MISRSGTEARRGSSLSVPPLESGISGARMCFDLLFLRMALLERAVISNSSTWPLAGSASNVSSGPRTVSPRPEPRRDAAYLIRRGRALFLLQLFQRGLENNPLDSGRVRATSSFMVSIIAASSCGISCSISGTITGSRPPPPARIPRMNDDLLAAVRFNLFGMLLMRVSHPALITRLRPSTDLHPVYLFALDLLDVDRLAESENEIRALFASVSMAAYRRILLAEFGK